MAKKKIALGLSTAALLLVLEGVVLVIETWQKLGFDVSLATIVTLILTALTFVISTEGGEVPTPAKPE